MPARSKPRAVRPPQGLVVEKLLVGDEELVVFSWATRPLDAPAGLSSAESEVLARVVRGESNAAIAKARKTSVRTVANQVASLLRKTGSASRYELIRRFTGATRG